MRSPVMRLIQNCLRLFPYCLIQKLMAFCYNANNKFSMAHHLQNNCNRCNFFATRKKMHHEISYNIVSLKIQFPENDFQSD